MTGLRRFGPLLAVGLMLAAAAVAAMLASPQIRPTQPDAGRPNPVPTYDLGTPTVPAPAPPAAARPGSIQLPDWLMLVAKVLCALVVIAVLALLLWYLLRNGLPMRQRRVRPAPNPAPAGAREQVIAAVDAGLSELDDSDADPRRAVIACWVRLEQAAAGAGTARRVGDTPTELVSRLLTGHAVSAPVLYQLAEAYRLARYATHTVDTSMRDQARAALGQVRAELAGERVA